MAEPLTVIIAEKPSVARDIATYFATLQKGAYKSEEGGYRLPNGDFVTYSVGHLIQMEMPDAYLTPAQDKADPLTYLPLFPESYKYRPRDKRNENGSVAMRDGKPVPDPLFRIVERNLKKASTIINAGDVGREGQLIMDEIFIYIGLDPNSAHIKRAYVVDPSPAGMKQAFSNLQQNSEPKWANSRMAGQCRQEADFEVGINGSRAYWSLTGDWRVALGRIRTPVLNLVSSRCEQIENFKPVQYYVPVVILRDGLEMRWRARAGAEGMAGFDLNGRIISKSVADDVVARITGGLQGRILNSRATDKRVAPPLPFSLVKLQSEASKRLQISVEAVTKAAQSLYEKHKMITYVGTECEYLPETMLAEARGIMAGLSPMYHKLMSGANASLRPASFNDKKLDEHHGIVPKGNLPNGALSDDEKGVFDIITRRFAAQFYPDYAYTSIAVEAEFGRDGFVARDMVVKQNGWKEAEGTADADGEDDNVVMSAGQPVEDENPLITDAN